MKKKFYLPLLAAALLCLAGLAGQAQTGQPQRRSSMTQAWEYKVITRARGFDAPKSGDYFSRARDWEFWSDNGKTLPLPVNMVAKLTELGAQGWELVSVTPKSSLTGAISVQPVDYAGFTTDELWVFKRPKP